MSGEHVQYSHPRSAYVLNLLAPRVGHLLGDFVLLSANATHPLRQFARVRARRRGGEGGGEESAIRKNNPRFRRYVRKQAAAARRRSRRYRFSLERRKEVVFQALNDRRYLSSNDASFVIVVFEPAGRLPEIRRAL